MEIGRALASFHLLLLRLLLSILMASISQSSAYDFYVGGKDGWGLNPREKFNNWAERNRFQVNDKLVFRYNKEEDSVLQVKKEDYDTCNTTSPIRKMEDGNSVFLLDRSGHFFFISGAQDRCENGEKLVVAVLAVRNNPGKKTPPPALPPSFSSSSAPLPSASAPSPSASRGPNFRGVLVPRPAPPFSEEEGGPAATSAAPCGLNVKYRVYFGVVGVVLGGVYFI